MMNSKKITVSYSSPLIKDEKNSILRTRRGREWTSLYKKYGFNVLKRTENGKGLIIGGGDRENAPPEFNPIFAGNSWYQITTINEQDITEMMFERAAELLRHNSSFPLKLEIEMVEKEYTIEYRKRTLRVTKANNSPYAVKITSTSDKKSDLLNRILGYQFIVAVNDIDCKSMDFDAVVELIKTSERLSQIAIRIMTIAELRECSKSETIEMEEDLVFDTPLIELRASAPRRKGKKNVETITDDDSPNSPPRKRSRPLSNTATSERKKAKKGPAIIELKSDSEENEKAVGKEDDNSDEENKMHLRSFSKSGVRSPYFLQLSKGAVVKTPFGDGQIISGRKNPPIYLVKVACGVAYLQPQSVQDVSDEKISQYCPTIASKGKIVFTRGDIGRLSSGEYLNDNIIDFYLSQLQQSEEVRGISDQLHVFSSFFFQIFRRAEARQDGLTKDNSMMKAFEEVANWTKNVVLFDKKFIFVPVNESTHWSLAVICNLDAMKARESPIQTTSCDICKPRKKKTKTQKESAGETREESDTDTRKRPDPNSDMKLIPSDSEIPVAEIHQESGSQMQLEEGEDKQNSSAEEGSPQTEKKKSCACAEENQKPRPCILILDSLKCHRTVLTTNSIRRYLRKVWETQFEKQYGEREINAKTLPAITPVDIPRQTNTCDCGVFLLHYAELLMQQPPEINSDFIETKARSNPIMSKKWFMLKDIDEKRILIKKKILALPAAV